MLRNGVVDVLLLLILHTGNASDLIRPTPSDKSDKLAEIALEKVPAKLGEQLQIRCAQIVEIRGHDRYDTLSCDTNWQRGTNCNYVWSKNGVALSSGQKYQIERRLTFDYCETFERTTDMMRKTHLQVVNPDKYYDKELKCFASALTIRNVTLSDLGDYQCKLVSDYENDKSYYNTSKTISVFNSVTTPVKLPAKIYYFGSTYPKSIRSNLLMQCVVSGGPVNWFVRFEVEGCNRYCTYKDNETIRPIESIGKVDGWRCFNFTVSNHQPYKTDQVSESFLYVENICSSDWVGVYCSANSDGSSRSELKEIVQMRQDYNRWSDWEQEHMLFVMALIVVPIVVSVFFFVAGVLACYRAKASACCGGQNVPRSHAFALINPPQIPVAH